MSSAFADMLSLAFGLLAEACFLAADDFAAHLIPVRGASVGAVA